jgi:hypothetical protein
MNEAQKPRKSEWHEVIHAEFVGIPIILNFVYEVRLYYYFLYPTILNSHKMRPHCINTFGSKHDYNRKDSKINVHNCSLFLYVILTLRTN